VANDAETTTEEIAVSKAAQTLHTYRDAFAKGDVDGLAALYAPRTDYRQPATTQLLTTPDAVRAFEAGMFAGFSGITIELDWVIANGNEAAAGARIRATHTGAMPTPDGGAIAATNKTIELQTAEHIRVDDEGKIVEHQRYSDMLGFMAQHGGLPG
jgi:ketosteroid isomerase-like protein